MLHKSSGLHRPALPRPPDGSGEWEDSGDSWYQGLEETVFLEQRVGAACSLWPVVCLLASVTIAADLIFVILSCLRDSRPPFHDCFHSGFLDSVHHAGATRVDISNTDCLNSIRIFRRLAG